MIPTTIDRSLLPHKPGVYQFKDHSGKVIYVGKAIDLFHRVSSYFNGAPDSLKTAALVENIHSVETIVVESEVEALLLEANLIKKYLPHYNIKLTDDKDYLYVRITHETYPRIVTARKQDLNDSQNYFGPFPSATTVKSTLKRLRRVFPWCSNPPGSMNRHNRPCFYYHLGLCPGPCAGMIDQVEYNKIIKNFSKFMQGKRDELLSDLQKEMEQAAKATHFEYAQAIKRTMEGIHYLLQPTRSHIYLENPNFLEDQRQKSLESLQKDLNLPSLPERIECFDISNIMGTNAVGSMVVLTNGEIDKSQYRKFKIHISGKPDDVGMHKEMMQRRLKHDEWQKPDLMVIDGGRGQVRVIKELLDQKGWDIPVYGLAKRLEWLYHPEQDIVKLSRSSASVKLLQKIRDEAHRFAISYHRKLRSKAVFEGLIK